MHFLEVFLAETLQLALLTILLLPLLQRDTLKKKKEEMVGEIDRIFVRIYFNI